MISETENRKRIEKPLGIYLVEAGIVTPKQVEIALDEQKRSKHKRLGEVLASHGWVAQETIEYLMSKVVLPERQVIEHLSFAQTSSYETLQLGSLPAVEVKFDISSVKVVRFLLLVVLSLISFHLWLQFSLYFLPDYPLRDTFLPLFNVDKEQNIPALYSVLALVFCAFLLAIIALRKRSLGDRYVNHWIALTIIFAYIAIDEAVSIHELAVEPIRNQFNTGGFLYYAWVIPAFILLVVFLIAFLKFITDLPAKTKRLFLIAGGVFVSGTIGMEIIGGFVVDTYGKENFVYSICTSIEELLEMLGIVIFVHALFSYITTSLKVSSVKFNLIGSRQGRSV